MAQLLFLRGAKQVLTLHGRSGLRRGTALQDLAVIEGGSVLIRDGKIASVGPTRRMENLKEVKDAIEISLAGAIVMPGFVDPCIQLTLCAPVLGSPKRKKLSIFYNESLQLMRLCLQHGTLNAEVKAASGLETIRSDLAMLRQLSRIGNNPIGMIRAWQPNGTIAQRHYTPQSVGQAFALLRKRQLAELIETGTGADQSGAETLWNNAAESAMGVNLVWKGGDAGGLSSLIPRLRPRAIFVSCELSEPECSVLANAAAATVFAPDQAMLAGRSSDYVRKFVDQSGAIALASGYHAIHSPMFNMQTSIALAVLRFQLTIEEAITAATINAAYAVGRGEEVGTLEVGKRADVIVLNLADYREIPRRFGINHVTMAIRDGNVVFNRTRWKASSV